MPQYIVTSPDGKKFRITAPDGASQEDVLAYAQQQFSAQPKPSLAQSNPGEYDPSSQEYQAKYGATSGMTWGDKFSAGVGKSLVDTGRGIMQLGAMAADAVAPRAPSMSQLISGQDPSRSAEVQQEVDAAAQRDAALMNTGAGVTGNVLGQMAQFAIPGGYVARGGKLAARVARGAGFGAAVANTQPVTSDQSRLTNTAIGAAGGGAGEAAAAGIGRLAAAASDKIAPEVAKLAQRARELGIPLRVEQATQSRPLAGISAALDAVPFSGRDASRNAQRAAWNRALARTIGENDTNLTAAVDKADTALSNKYNSVLGRYGIKADQQLSADFKTALDAAESELDPQQFARLSRQVETLTAKAANGEIDGRAAYNVKKILDRIGKNSDSSLAFHAREIRDVLMTGLDRSLPADVAKAFAKTRQQYSNLITLRKGLRAGAEGTVTPARLATLNTRGDLKELADIGATFLTEPFGNSGTANRMVGLGILGGAGLATDLATAGQFAATGATAGRGVNALLQAQPVVNYALRGSDTLRKAVPYANALFPAAGAIAGQ